MQQRFDQRRPSICIGPQGDRASHGALDLEGTRGAVENRVTGTGRGIQVNQVVVICANVGGDR